MSNKFREIDLTQILMMKLLNNNNNNQPGMNSDGVDLNKLFNKGNNDNNIGSMKQSNVCVVKEGSPYYVKLQTGDFGGRYNLVLHSGVLSGNTVNREFEYKGKKSCYLVDNMTSTIDLAKIQENLKEKLIFLIEISAPFVGTVFVPEEYVVSSTPIPPGSRQTGILKG